MTSVPIPTLHLFHSLDEKLIEVLESLSAEDWNRRTVAPLWTVKDVAAHLLDVSLRTVSLYRDGFSLPPESKIESYSDLVSFLNALNGDWVKAAKRISPELLVEFLKSTLPKHCQVLEKLHPFEKAVFSVAWAGEMESQNWFHVAREYTEKFHHQMQIRLAVGRDEELLTDAFYHPFLQTSMRALPHHFRNQSGKTGESLEISITGNGGGSWFLTKSDAGWDLSESSQKGADSKILVDGKIAWRIFTKGISQGEAEASCEFTGNRSLKDHFFKTLAVIA